MATDDTIIKFPAALERRAERIRVAMIRRDKGDQEWIEGTLDLSVELATARADFPVNRDFGDWCADNGFGDNALPKNERAILVQWGNKPDWTRTVLEKTERRSVQFIHSKEWVVTSASNNPSLTVKPPGGVQRKKAVAYVQVFEAAQNELPPETVVARDTGVSRGTAADVLRDIKSRRANEDVKITFAKAQDYHVEAKLRMLSRKLESEFAERVRLKALEENKDYLAELEQLEKQANYKNELYDSLINSHKPIFTEAEYMTILACLHPDNSASERTREIAFKAFNVMKFQLTGKR